MAADHAGHILHWLDLGAQDVCAPLLEHGGDDVDLLAIEDSAQAFAVEPGAGGAFGGGVGDQSIEVGARFDGQPMAVPEQCPTQAFEAGIAPLFKPPGLIEGGRGVGDDMSVLTAVICSGRALWAVRCSAKRATVVASRPSVTNTTLRSAASAAMVRYRGHGGRRSRR